MKRKLLKQLRYEWRSNLWLIAELFIMSVVIWYVLVLMFSSLWQLTVSPGYDITGVYKVNFTWVPSDAPTFDASRDGREPATADLLELRRRLLGAPGVQAVGFSYNAMPYNYNYNGNRYKIARADNPDSVVRVNFNQKSVSPSYLAVLNICGVNGETPQELGEFIDRGGILLSEDFVDHIDPEMSHEGLADKFLYMYDDSATTKFKVVPMQKRNDYEWPGQGATIFYKSIDEKGNDDLRYVPEMALRVSHGSERDFEQWVADNLTRQLKVGNVYVTDLLPASAIREDNQRDITQLNGMIVACITFMMISIFLGLLGTFWLRTQQRAGEIAMRMVNGASASSVFRRLIGEGLLLLAFVTPPALLLDWLLWHYDLVATTFTECTAPVFWSCAGIALALLALMIILGIWFPGRRAMHIDPARTLADE